MAKSKKLTFNMIWTGSSKMADTVVRYNAGKQEFELTVKRTLSLDDARAFVAGVVRSVINSATGDYKPELYDFVLRMFTLIFYAGVSAPTNLEKAYDIIYKTVLYETVMAEIDMTQYRDIVTAIDKYIEFEKDIIMSTQMSRVNEVISRIDSLFDQSTKAVETVTSEDFLKQITEAVKIAGNNASIDVTNDAAVVADDKAIVVFPEMME